MKLICLILLGFFGDILSSPTQIRRRRSAPDLKRICYFPSWSMFRTGDGYYDAKTIDPALCTHVIFSFTELNPSTFQVENYHDKDPEQLAQLRNLKVSNPNLKILIAIGGWNAGTARFEGMVSSQSNRQIFITSLLSYLQQHQLDGFDLDWEYPRGIYKTYLNDLMKELRESFGSQYTLSIAIGTGRYNLENSYDLTTLKDYVDWIGMMTYDYYGTWSGQTGHHSPLHPAPGQDSSFSSSYAVDELLKQGVSASQIIVGIPLYGRSFTVNNPTGGDPGTGAGAGAGIAGYYTATAGFLAYYEICPKVRSTEWTEVIDASHVSTYAYGGNQFVSYDGVYSTQLKCEYVMNENLGGVMVWDISMDDFHNKCGYGANPLLTTIKSVFTGDKIPEQDTSTINPACNFSPTPTTPTETTTPKKTTARSINNNNYYYYYYSNNNYNRETINWIHLPWSWPLC